MTTITTDQSSQRRWFKSSYSAGVGTDCVEISVAGGPVRVRDSKNPGGPVLAFSGGEWDAFLGELARPGGRFERA